MVKSIDFRYIRRIDQVFSRAPLYPFNYEQEFIQQCKNEIQITYIFYYKERTVSNKKGQKAKANGKKITTRIIKVNNGKNQSTYNHGIASKYIN